ncbi:hypothetical protein ABZX92_12940 [Lentzea sp. NPDC006480]|uniref:HEAT repeat domain-containing protein n=1 Tax=Lentzea sp. NPDC006480 TaxID=3157176 RepID=UPI0033BCF4E9
MLEGLGDIAWDQLEHNCGTAEEIPHLLRARRWSTKPDWDLGELLWDSYGPDSAANAALPFLVDLASSVDTPWRICVLINLSRLARDGVDDPDWLRVWGRERLRVLALVEDDDPAVRRHAWRTFGDGRGSASGVLEMIRRCWSDVPSRLDIVVAAGKFAADDEIAAWLRGLPTDDPQFRLAVAYALELGVEEFLPGFSGDMEVWWETASFGIAPGAVIGEMTEVFADRPAEHTALLRELSAVPHRRRAVVHNAGTLLGRWRSPAAELLPIAASWLEDPDPHVRYEAVYLLGCARSAEHADAIAALLDDDALMYDKKISDAAAWALARCGRQVPGLVRRLRPYPRSNPIRRYLTLVPSLGQTLDWLVAEALPDVTELVALLDTEHRYSALSALGEIGTPVPELTPADPLAAWAWWKCGGDPVEAADVIATDVTEDGVLRRRAVELLRHIGPAAAHLADRLPMSDERLPMRVQTRYAYLRMTGDPGDLVAVCTEALDGVGTGRFEHVMIAAAEALGEAGVRLEAAAPALASDRRLCCHAGWRAFDQDEEMRSALRNL